MAPLDWQDAASATGDRYGVDLTSTRPGTPGGTFLRRFWLAVGRSEDLPAGQAKPIRIMSEDYALYRAAAQRHGGGRRLDRDLFQLHAGR